MLSKLNISLDDTDSAFVPIFGNVYLDSPEICDTILHSSDVLIDQCVNQISDSMCLPS
jgi:hypothetical protein